MAKSESKAEAKTKQPQWVQPPSHRVLNAFSTAWQIPGLVLVLAPIFLLLLWLASWLKTAGVLSSESTRWVVLALPIVFMAGMVLYWYLRYLRSAVGWLIAGMPILNIPPSIQLGQLLPFRITQSYRRDAWIQSIQVSLELWVEFALDDAVDVEPTLTIQQVSGEELRIQSKELRPGTELIVDGEIRLPSREKWNEQIEALAHQAGTQPSQVEARLVIDVQIQLQNQVDYQQRFWITEDQNLATSDPLKPAQ